MPALVGAVLGLGQVARVYAADAALVEKLRQQLAPFATTQEAVALTKAQIKALESEDYLERRQAMSKLITSTAVKQRLDEMGLTLSVEADTALEIIQAAQEETGAEEKLRLLMRRIHMERIQGLTKEILLAWEGRTCTSSDSVRLGREALKATVAAEDVPLLKERLQSKTPFVRELSLVGLQKLLVTEEVMGELLVPLLQDPSESVRLEAAVLAVYHGNRDSLGALASLLDSEAFHLRNQSHEILSAVTEQDFDYYSDGVLKDRKEAAKLWQRWVAKFGAKADLQFQEIQYWLQEDDQFSE